MASASVPDFTPGYTDSRGDYVPTDDQVQAYQAARATEYDSQLYGYWTLAALLGVLAIFTALNVFWRLKAWARGRDRDRDRDRRRASLQGADERSNANVGVGRGRGRRAAAGSYSKTAAILRCFTYPRLRKAPLVRHIWTIGPLGPNLLILAGLLLVSLLQFVNKYWFYPSFYGDAPFYLRSSWIALACLPFLFVLGSKRNLIAFLTGVPHHHLQVLHQGMALIFTYMVVVHVIGASIQATRDYGFRLEFSQNSSYPSGAIAFGALLVLLLGTFPFIRQRIYEIFWLFHIAMVIVFIGALGAHLDMQAAYVYYGITVALFGASVIARFVMMLFNNPKPHLATARILDETTLSLTMPTRMSWKAGAHVFVRILEVRPLESHPFSIFGAAPAAEAGAGAGAGSLRGRFRLRRTEPTELKFIIRPQDGFTKALYSRVAARGGECSLRCIVDGPYGGHVGLEHGMDGVLCVAAGSGITGVLGLAQQIAAVQAQDTAGGLSTSKRSVKLVWATRTQDSIAHVQKPLEALRASGAHVDIQIYVTGPVRRASISPTSSDQTLAPSPAPETEKPAPKLSPASAPVTPTSMPAPAIPPTTEPFGASDVEKALTRPDAEKAMARTHVLPTMPGSPGGLGWSVVYGRPDAKAEVALWAAEQKGHLAVVVCGPSVFSADLANAVTKVQRGILTGRYPDVAEMVLETETFGW